MFFVHLTYVKITLLTTENNFAQNKMSSKEDKILIYIQFKNKFSPPLCLTCERTLFHTYKSNLQGIFEYLLIRSNHVIPTLRYQVQYFVHGYINGKPKLIHCKDLSGEFYQHAITLRFFPADDNKVDDNNYMDCSSEEESKQHKQQANLKRRFEDKILYDSCKRIK
jgi:hypothetical protein